MNYTLSESTAFQIAEVSLKNGEQIKIENGCMAYHTGGVTLEGKMNSNGTGGLGGALKAMARSVVSGESFFVTTAKGMSDDAKIVLAPSVPGAIRELQIGSTQWRIRDNAFLACDASVSYEVKRQSFGKALFGGTGGFFIMQTAGMGSMLVNSYGDIIELQCDGSQPIVVDNTHVVAWTTTLDYEIKAASGTFGFMSGEGLVNQFKGIGTILIQTRNMSGLAGSLKPYLPSNG